MKYLLDSSVVIFLASGTDKALKHRAARCDEGDMVTSTIVLAEVAHGSMNDKAPSLDELKTFLEEVRVLPFDEIAAKSYARLPFRRASYDRLIAAHTLSLELILVSSNLKHFADVPGLRVENWTI